MFRANPSVSKGTWSWREKKTAHGCAACICHALLHSGGTHSCAACVFLFVWPFRQQDSKTPAVGLLTCSLDRWLLVTSQLFARMEKMLRPKRAWTLDPQVTVNSPGGLSDSTWHENDNTIECWNHIEWKGNSTGLNKKVSLQLRHFDWAEKKLDRWNWGEVSQHEFKGVERRREMKRELRRVKKMCAEMKVVEKSCQEVRNRWKSWEVVSQFATRGQKSWKEHGSLPQLL